MTIVFTFEKSLNLTFSEDYAKSTVSEVAPPEAKGGARCCHRLKSLCFRNLALGNPLLTKIGTLNNQSMIGQNPAGFAIHLRISGVSLVFW